MGPQATGLDEAKNLGPESTGSHLRVKFQSEESGVRSSALKDFPDGLENGAIWFFQDRRKCPCRRLLHVCSGDRLSRGCLRKQFSEIL